jgi:hypothetical protein
VGNQREEEKRRKRREGRDIYSRAMAEDGSFQAA